MDGSIACYVAHLGYTRNTADKINPLPGNWVLRIGDLTNSSEVTLSPTIMRALTNFHTFVISLSGLVELI
jgi:hypothetical protein